MSKIITLALIQVASFCSVLGLYFTLLPIDQHRPLWHWLVILIVALAFGGVTANDVRASIRTLPKVFNEDAAIRQYMRNWVSSGGRAVIFSRDLSWVDDETNVILERKARRSELIICVERHIDLTKRLQIIGARIVCYGDLHHVPVSRFTIIDYEKDGARVAVGVKSAGKHVIQEYQSGHDPFFAVADDLAKFVIRHIGQAN